MKKQTEPRKTATTNKAAPSPARAKPASKHTTASKRMSKGKHHAGVHRVDSDARRAMIAQAAYFRAEKRGFARGGELNDWFEAEREISHILES